MVQLLLKIQDYGKEMTEFRENLIMSTNILLWLMIALYMFVIFFNPMDMDSSDKAVLMVFACVSFLSLLTQLIFNKVIDLVYDFFKNYEVKKKA